MLGPKMAPKSTKKVEKSRPLKRKRCRGAFFYIFEPKMTLGNTPNSVFERMNPRVKCISLHHGFFSLLGAKMGPCWHPKSKKNWKKEAPEGVQKASNFQNRFCPLLVLSWEPTWLQVGAQDSPRQRPRAPKSRPGRPLRQPRDPPEAQSDSPRRLGPPKMTPRTFQNDPMFLDFKVHLCGFQKHF